jgi:hypothetical protein
MRFKIALLTLSQLWIISLMAQVSSTSPYTSFGIGETNNGISTIGNSMGGANIANMDSSNINIVNPASYALISMGKPILNVSGISHLSRFETTTDTLNTSLFGLNSVVLSFPIRNNWGFTIGLNPFSKVGYKIQETKVFDEKNVRESYVGDGAINKVFAGLAYRPLNNMNNQLSIGFNIGYMFGTISRARSHEFTDVTTHFNTKSIQSLKINDLYFDAGLIYQRKINSSSSISAGVTYELGKKLNAERETFTYSFSGSLESENYLDTIGYSLEADGSIQTPHKFGVGINYELFGNRDYQNDKLDYLLKVGFDYTMQDWSKFQVTFNDVSSSDSMKSASRYSLGLEFTPSINLIKKPQINYFKTMKYRIGGHYKTLPYYKNGTQLNQFGMSFGLGFPVPIKFTNASVNLGMELGQRGTTDNNLVREKFIGVYFGLSLSPSVKWFQKRKYD